MAEDRKEATFQYTYSAKQQEEIKRIRNKYLPQKENKMEQLRRLDAQVNRKATMYSIIVGVIGALILGLGMSCCLVWGGVVFVLGIFIGVAGMALLSLAYPIYNKTMKKEREKIAPEILRLTEELIK